MSDTPRTDALACSEGTVDADHARELERELDAAKRDANQWETQAKVARIQRDNARAALAAAVKGVEL